MSKKKLPLYDKYYESVEQQLATCRETLIHKNSEYDPNGLDPLNNFYKAAQLTGETHAKALAGMMVKHTVSIYDMLGSEDRLPKSQWVEKITDHINYLLILRTMVDQGYCAYDDTLTIQPDN